MNAIADVARAAPGRLGERRIPAKLADYAAPIALVIVWLGFFIATPNFLTTSNIDDLLVASTILTVLALGQQFAVVVGGIDLSVGATLPWSAALLGYFTSHGYPLTAGIVVAILGGLLVGVINGLLIGHFQMTDFVVTLGSLSVLSGCTLLLTSGNSVAVNSPFLQSLALDGAGPLRWFWLLALVAALGVAGILFRTRVGTHLLATGGNIDSARETGIPVRRIRLLAYSACGLLCGVAGVMLVARNGGADPSLQTTYLLSSIAAVVLGGSSLSGGKASVLGTVCGAILFTSLINGFTILGISQYYQPIAVGAVLLLAAAISRFRK
ncbi:ABC transporter permease [Nocardia colli]|uniref:ABC transporter permease n=1 Tax=Nocardia colli TaxID=2545717 RepID=UPI001CC5F64B|nr:ABC transporter permease [Nocardia colli]